MAEQRTFPGLTWSTKEKVTHRERFLAEMNAVISWCRLIALIEPYYPKGGSGGQPNDLEEMLRIYYLQQWFDLSDPQQRTRSMTLSRCGGSQEWSWGRMTYPTSRRFCGSAISWRSMG